MIYTVRLNHPMRPELDIEVEREASGPFDAINQVRGDVDYADMRWWRITATSTDPTTGGACQL